MSGMTAEDGTNSDKLRITSAPASAPTVVFTTAPAGDSSDSDEDNKKEDMAQMEAGTALQVSIGSLVIIICTRFR